MFVCLLAVPSYCFIGTHIRVFGFLTYGRYVNYTTFHIPQVRYERDDASPFSSPFSLQGGQSFKAGTWCSVRAANTPSPSLACLQCLNPRFLKYTEYSDCFVYGKCVCVWCVCGV